MFDIAIVGFGATGVSFLYQLHNHLDANGSNINIAVISPKDSFSSGLAFGQSAPFHKVNTPPELMGIDPEDPRGFSNWMRKNKIDKDKFPTRKTYSQYLKNIFENIKDDKALNLVEYYSAAIDIDVINGTNYIRLQDGKIIKTKQVVLALGSITVPMFKSISGILPKNIKESDSIKSALVAGTGLTAVDCVRSLARCGCENIHMFSRNGFAPTVISNSVEYMPEYFTWENLKKSFKEHQRGNRLPGIKRLLRNEISKMKNPEIFEANRLLNRKKLSEYWSYLLRRSDNCDLPFQDTLVSTRYYAHKVWQKLSDEEKLSFQRQYGAFWACWRHPIPVQVIKELIELVNEGRLSIHKSQMPLVKEHKDYILKTRDHTYRSSVLVDGTGGGLNITDAESPLLKNMVNKGLCKPNPCGGLCVDNLTFSVKNDIGTTSIYCLGPLAKGDFLSTNALWFNAGCAAKLAQLLIIKMGLRTSEEVYL